MFCEVVSKMSSVTQMRIQAMKHKNNGNRIPLWIMPVGMQMYVFFPFRKNEIDKIILMKLCYTLRIGLSVFFGLFGFIDPLLFYL